jgi:hypothetical protein
MLTSESYPWHGSKTYDPAREIVLENVANLDAVERGEGAFYKLALQDASQILGQGDAGELAQSYRELFGRKYPELMKTETE